MCNVIQVVADEEIKLRLSAVVESEFTGVEVEPGDVVDFVSEDGIFSLVRIKIGRLKKFGFIRTSYLSA